MSEVATEWEPFERAIGEMRTDVGVLAVVSNTRRWCDRWKLEWDGVDERWTTLRRLGAGNAGDKLAVGLSV